MYMYKNKCKHKKFAVFQIDLLKERPLSTPILFCSMSKFSHGKIKIFGD